MTLAKSYFDTNINHELHGYFSWCHRCSNEYIHHMRNTEYFT